MLDSSVPVLHPKVEEELIKIHRDLSANGELLAAERLQDLYATFRERFGPDALQARNGEDLLGFMHDTGNRDGLVYWLEFKDDNEFPAIFGSIAGGSALKFGLYRRRETGAWMTGSSQAQREISTAEAVAIARKHRDEFIAACEELDRLPQDADDGDYRRLQEVLGRVAPTVNDLAWGHKYLSLIFPEKLDTFHSAEYQRFHLIRLLQMPPDFAGRYVCAGRFVALARRFNWPLKHLSTVLYRRNNPWCRYWRVGTRDENASYWDMMRTQSVTAVGWPRLGDLSDRLTAPSEFKDWLRGELDRQYANPPQTTGRSVQQLSNFCLTMTEGDRVLACDGATVLGVGIVAGPYQFDGTKPFPHMRPVRWMDVRDWHLPTTEGLRTTVHEFRKHPENLVAIEAHLLDPYSPAAHTVPVQTQPTVQQPAEAVKPMLWTDGGAVGRIQQVLLRKGQLILYGPPGTGKTYWAEMAARNLAALWNYGTGADKLADEQRERLNPGRADSFVRFCSFHPAYGYEDFIEGYRPVSRGGALHFELHDGLFKVICEQAAAEPDKNFYLIIDEINRGDIPRIFGELLTLLEKSKRGVSMSLPLSGSTFAVPPNVFVLGTMNTADRSIALLDAALRRRFGFIELMPDPDVLGNTVIAGIPLGPWLASLNRLITSQTGRDGRNLQVGHSYLLAGAGRPIDDLARFAQVLREDILPLLEEYCYDNWETLEAILGSALVDVDGRRFRSEVFAPGRQDDLVQAVLAGVPEISASTIAIAADAPEQEDSDTESEASEA